MANAASYQRAVDGTVTEIAGHSAYYTMVTEAIGDTITNLKTVTNSLNTESEAVVAFEEVALRVQSDLELLKGRYATLAQQLGFYANALDGYQQRGDYIQSLARNASDTLETKRTAITNKEALLGNMGLDDPARPRQEQALRTLYTQYNEAVTTLRNADSNLDDVLDEWRAYADACAQRIRDAVDGSELNDSWWDKFTDWVENSLPDIEFWLDIISIVLTVIAIILVFTGVGAAIAPFLMLAARAAQFVSKVLKVIKTLTLVIQVMRGEKSPTALVDFALQMAVDKLVGKAMEIGLDKLGSLAFNQIAKSDWAQDLMLKHAIATGNDTILENFDLIEAFGFDDWTEGVFDNAIKFPGSDFLQGTTNFFDKGADFIDAPFKMGTNFLLDSLSGMPGSFTQADGIGSMMIEHFAGPSTTLSGLGVDIVNLGLEPLGIEIKIENSLGLATPPPPTYDQIMASVG